MLSRTEVSSPPTLGARSAITQAPCRPSPLPAPPFFQIQHQRLQIRHQQLEIGHRYPDPSSPSASPPFTVAGHHRSFLHRCRQPHRPLSQPASLPADIVATQTHRSDPSSPKPPTPSPLLDLPLPYLRPPCRATPRPRWPSALPSVYPLLPF
ncbi:extensin-like [Diospyros lotus]|uniref:extensin-like n=1 Tax=Diospyros lotus TaxID=55363 RepID=UPI00224F243A|nr:extensin-like [Diospyros lotus]